MIFGGNGMPIALKSLQALGGISVLSQIVSFLTLTGTSRHRINYCLLGGENEANKYAELGLVKDFAASRCLKFCPLVPATGIY